MAVTFGKIKTLATVAITLFSLNSGQEKQLDNYVKMYENQWVEQRKSEAEVELLIKDKARSIAGK